MHDESCSRKSNLFEARLVYDMAACGVEEQRCPATVSVIPPPRAGLMTVLRGLRYHLKL